MTEKKDNSLVYVLAGLLGALLGMGTVYMLEKSSRLNDQDNLLTRKNVSRVGLGAISFLYSLIGSNKKQ